MMGKSIKKYFFYCLYLLVTVFILLFLGGSFFWEKELKNSFESALEDAKSGNVEAQFTVAYLFENGYGIETNEEKAKQWYLLAAKNGSPQARLYICTFSEQMIKKTFIQKYSEWCDTKKNLKAIDEYLQPGN